MRWIELSYKHGKSDLWLTQFARDKRGRLYIVSNSMTYREVEWKIDALIKNLEKLKRKAWLRYRQDYHGR